MSTSDWQEGPRSPMEVDHKAMTHLLNRYTPEQLVGYLRTTAAPQDPGHEIPQYTHHVHRPERNSVMASSTDSSLSAGTTLSWETVASNSTYQTCSTSHDSRSMVSANSPTYIGSVTPSVYSNQSSDFLPGQAQPPPSSADGRNDPASPAVAASRKAFDCPFCLEVGIGDGASRISDLRRHFRTKHNTNAQWKCSIMGCQMVFDWQSAYEYHLKKKHPENEKNFALPPNEAVVACKTQVVFACGFDTCRKVFETPSEDHAEKTANEYFHHVANHFQDGTSTDDWFYSRRIRNLLRQSQVRETWKAMKPHFGRQQLKWQHHNSSVLRKMLECQDIGDPSRLVKFAVLLGSPPYSDPNSPQPALSDEYVLPTLDDMVTSWQRENAPQSAPQNTVPQPARAPVPPPVPLQTPQPMNRRLRTPTPQHRPSPRRTKFVRAMSSVSSPQLAIMSPRPSNSTPSPASTPTPTQTPTAPAPTSHPSQPMDLGGYRGAQGQMANMPRSPHPLLQYAGFEALGPFPSQREVIADLCPDMDDYMDQSPVSTGPRTPQP